MQARLAATCLILQAIVVLFAGMAAAPFTDHAGSTVWPLTWALFAGCVIATALVRRRGGILIGWLMQIATLVAGFWYPAAWFIAPIFTGLWLWLTLLGARIDRDRAARAGGSNAAPDSVAVAPAD